MNESFAKEPIRPSPGGVCMAIHAHGSVCEHKPDFEIYAPNVSRKIFVLCKMHKMMVETCFRSIGIYYQEFEHDYKGKQKELF